MQPLPRNLTDKFADAFAGEKRGFSARQISDYFVSYSNLVKPYDHYGVNPTRHQLFIECVYALVPKHQYYALNDLAYVVCESKYSYPSEDERRELITQLHNFISTSLKKRCQEGNFLFIYYQQLANNAQSTVSGICF